MNGNHEGKVAPGKRGRRLSKARLDELVEEALVDAYGESEQATGFYTMIENDLCLPFETEMLGVTVSVESEYSGPSGALIPFEVGQDSVVMWGAIPLGCGARIERERNRAPHARNRAPRGP